MRFPSAVVSAALLIAAAEAHAQGQTNGAPQAEASLRDFSDAIASVAERAVPGVVNISTTQLVPGEEAELPPDLDPFFRPFLDRFRQRPQKLQSLGSGVLVKNDGTVLTSSHIVHGGDDISVTLSDGRTFQAKIVGSDPKSDLAVLRIENPPRNLTSIQMGDSDRLRVGEVVIAIGNPFGVGQTVTMGIVSATGRANIGIVEYEDFIQTDAAINPGNSGGALVNLRGELVGINTAILSRSGGYQGIGFAIPSNMASPIMNSLLTEGRVIRGWLGAMIQDLTPELAKEMNLTEQDGVLVSDVLANAPAQKGGLMPGDLVVELDGEKIDSAAELKGRVAAHRPGATIRLTIIRDGEEREVRVVLGELPEEAIPEPALSSNQEPEDPLPSDEPTPPMIER